MKFTGISYFVLALFSITVMIAASSASENLAASTNFKWSQEKVALFPADVGQVPVSEANALVKVGTPLVVNEASVVSEAFWGLEWLARPINASAKTKLFFYDLSDFAEHYFEIQLEIEDSNIRAALIGRGTTVGDYVAFPILLDDGIYDLFSSVAVAGEQDAVLTSIATQLAFNQVVKAAGRSETSKFISPAKTAASDVTGFWWDSSYLAQDSMIAAMKSDDSGVDFEKWKDVNSNSFTPMIATDREIQVLSDVGISPNSAGLTISDIYGRRLGSEIPSWPIDSD